MDKIQKFAISFLKDLRESYNSIDDGQFWRTQGHVKINDVIFARYFNRDPFMVR